MSNNPKWRMFIKDWGAIIAVAVAVASGAFSYGKLYQKVTDLNACIFPTNPDRDSTGKRIRIPQQSG